jgi:hypothetical protein
MNRVAIAIAGAAVAVVSFAIGRATRPTTPARVAERTKPVVYAREVPEPDPADDALRECETKLSLAEGILRAQEHEKLGDPVPFPADLPPQYRPEGFEHAIRAALAACDRLGDVELSHVDCSEFPCLAFFRPAPPSYGHQLDALWKCDALNDEFSSEAGGGNNMLMTDAGLV